VSRPENRVLPFAALAFTIFIWGVAPAIVRSFSLAAGGADALVIRMWSVAICCAVLLPFLGGFKVARQDMPRLLLISLGMFGYFAGTIFGFARVPASIGGIIFATQPLLIALLAAVFGVERMTVPTMLGLAVSFAGTFYLFSGDISGGVDRGTLINGGLMIFAGGLFWALYVIFSAPLIHAYGSFKITALSCILAALPSIFSVSSSTMATLGTLDTTAWAGLAFLTLVATLLSVSLWNFASAHLLPTTVGAALYLIPVLAVAASAILLNETITTTTLVGGAVILLGVALAQIWPERLMVKSKNNL
jgi:drug/metabolite transporter (DMT)-like permease